MLQVYAGEIGVRAAPRFCALARNTLVFPLGILV